MTDKIATSLSRKLKVLGFPKAERTLFANWSLGTLGDVLLWLEDEKIRAFDEKDRSGLRQRKDPKWLSEIYQYLEATGCPYSPPERNSLSDWAVILEWLINQAITLELKDKLREKGSPSSLLIQPKPTTAMPQFSKEDISDPVFVDAVHNLARIIRVPVESSPDTLTLLQSCCNVVVRKFHPNALTTAKETTQKLSQITDSNIDAESFPLGFQTGDILVDRAATILRLLHINELRTLQTYVNDMFDILQGFTANPRADPTLGKVGV